MKPEIVLKIEEILGKTLAQSPLEDQLDPLRTLIAIQKNALHKFLLDAEGRLIGLNLSVSELNNTKWQQIVDLLDSEAISLHALNLSENQLTEFLMPQALKQLRILDLSENQLTNVKLDPNKIDALQEIYLSDNPLTAPPPEVVQQGNKAILAWFASFKKDTGKQEHFLREIKILLVGEGMAGKTSLLKKIKDLPFSEHENQTHGVNVETLELGKLPMFKPYEQVKDVKARFWDFGGQEIMHASHQFFLTHRSIYVFVLDSRTDNKKDYWLRHIQKFGGKSPAIVAINKMDDNTSYSLEESSLNKKYGFIENRFIKMSCKTEAGLKQFAETLAELIPQTPLFNTPISESWLNIKDQLERETKEKKYIDRERFLKSCEQYGVNDPVAQSTLLSYLNSLGVVLHFQELSLQQFYVLDPHWVTIGVYKIMNSPSITDGILEEKDLDFILNREPQKNQEYDPSKNKSIQYSSAEQLYLVSIMKEFELLYEYEKGCYLVPDLLPKELVNPVQLDTVHSVTFIVEYDFLPPNVMSQFMISMKEDIHDLKMLWRTGALLSNSSYGCTALVKADMDDQRITIEVNGDERRKREYFAVICHKLCTINNKFEDLLVTQKMPVPDHPDIEVDYEELLGLEKMGIDDYPIGKLGKVFSVSSDFLDKISTKEEREQKQSAEKLELILKIDDRETISRLDHLDKKASAILSNQELQQKYLNTLVGFAAGQYQPDMPIYFENIDALENSNQDLIRVNALLDTQLNNVFSKLPATEKVAKGWKEANDQLSSDVDMKTKLKLKIPFVFGAFEQEFSWETKTLLKSLRQEWVAFKEGKKSLKQLFNGDD